MERSLIANVKLGECNKLQGFVENIRNKRTWPSWCCAIIPAAFS